MTTTSAASRAVSPAPHPIDITVHQQSRTLEIRFSDDAHFQIPLELMRVYSPSAEVQGHGPGQEVLQTGKRYVGLDGLEPVGNYAIKPIFSDGHDSGLFTWEYLYHLGKNQTSLWAQYEERLSEAGKTRDVDTSLLAKPGGAGGGHGCGHQH